MYIKKDDTDDFIKELEEALENGEEDEVED